MKVSAALSLCIAPLALAKAVHNVYPAHARRSQRLEAREQQQQKRETRVSVTSGVSANSVSGLSAAELQLLGLSGVGISENARTEVIVIWVNPGSNAATTVVNNPVTTTVTVQAGGGAAAATSAAANAGGEAAASSATVATGATSVVAGTGATHPVTVGGTAAGLAFNPPKISAAIGDMVIFTFLSNNHTVTQSAFATPCEPLAGGMDSGFQPNPNNTVNPPPQVAMQVMVDTPLWFFCKQNGHCGKGMTFSINPTAEKTQELFQSMAIAQNGTGAGSAITGNGGAAAAAPAAPAGSSAAAAAPAASATVAAGEGAAAATSSAAVGGEATATGAALGAIPTGFAVGQGSTDGTGACVCAVACNAAPFPAVAQGAGAFGGQPGKSPN